MNATRDLIIFIFIIVALGVAWYYTGGSANDLARTGPFLTLPGSTKPGTPAYHVPGVVRKPAATEEDDSTEVISNYLGTFTEERSPYAQYVSLEQSGADAGLKSEYLTI